MYRNPERKFLCRASSQDCRSWVQLFPFLLQLLAACSMHCMHMHGGERERERERERQRELERERERGREGERERGGETNTHMLARQKAGQSCYFFLHSSQTTLQGIVNAGPLQAVAETSLENGWRDLDIDMVVLGKEVSQQSAGTNQSTRKKFECRPRKMTNEDDKHCLEAPFHPGSNQTGSDCRTVMRTSQATATSTFDILHTVQPSSTQGLCRQGAERLCCSVAGSCSATVTGTEKYIMQSVQHILCNRRSPQSESSFLANSMDSRKHTEDRNPAILHMPVFGCSAKTSTFSNTWQHKGGQVERYNKAGGPEPGLGEPPVQSLNPKTASHSIKMRMGCPIRDAWTKTPSPSPGSLGSAGLHCKDPSVLPGIHKLAKHMTVASPVPDGQSSISLLSWAKHHEPETGRARVCTHT